MTDLRFLDPEGLTNRAAFNERFGLLNGLYQYWWRKTLVFPGYIEVRVDAVKNTSDSDLLILVSGNSHNVTSSISYSDTISINQDTGVISLVDPLVATVRDNDFYLYAKNDAANLLGKYITNVRNSADTIYYIPVDVETYQWDDGDSNYKGGFRLSGIKQISSRYVEDWEVDYVYSSDRNAYPDSGTVDGYEYEYLGIPFDNAREAPKFAVGRYAGTGTRGSENPNSLSFPFAPKVVLITIDAREQKMVYPVAFIHGQGMCSIISSAGGSGSFSVAFLSWKENTVSWYSNSISAEAQLNKADEIYHYVALG